jgi:hypothetical protein
MSRLAVALLDWTLQHFLQQIVHLSFLLSVFIVHLIHLGPALKDCKVYKVDYKNEQAGKRLDASVIQITGCVR